MKWPIYKINDICKVSGGKRLPKGHQFVDSKTKHPYIRITDMSFDSLSTDGLLYITEETFKHISRYTISKDDIYISIAGTIGYVGKIPEFIDGANLTENCAKLSEFSDEINRDYLLYYLRSPRGNGELLVRKGGASQPKLALERIKTVPVPVPPINIQSRIANILSAYDDLIQNNQKQIKLLEEAAMRLYKEWFVNLRFPGYENSKIVDGVPEGWERNKLIEIADIQYGFAFDSSKFNILKKGTPIIRIRNIPSGNTSDYTTEHADEQYLAYNGDIIVGMDGEFHINTWAGDTAYLVQRTCRIKPKNTIMKGYLLQAIYEPIKYFEKTITGATVAHLGKKHIDTITLLTAPEKYYLPFQYLFDKRQILLKQNVLLQEARDKLLPKLMSGEIEV